MVYMRDKRVIAIKSPKLRKIRNGLRMVFLKAVSAKWNELFDEMDKLSRYEDGTPKSVKKMTSIEEKRFRELQEEQSSLRSLAGRSICKCVTCGSPDRDMVYNKAYDAWYCTSCYGMERTYAKEMHQKRVKTGGKPKGYEEEAVESHSKTFL